MKFVLEYCRHPIVDKNQIHNKSSKIILEAETHEEATAIAGDYMGFVKKEWHDAVLNQVYKFD